MELQRGFDRFRKHTAQIQYLPIRTASLGYVRTVINNSTCNFPFTSIHSTRFIIEPHVSRSRFVLLFAKSSPNYTKLSRDNPFVHLHRYFNPIKPNYEICFTVPYHRRKRNYDAFHEGRKRGALRLIGLLFHSWRVFKHTEGEGKQVNC